MTRVACIGEAMIELSLNSETAQIGVAGDTLNTAIYLKRAAPSVQVDYVTCLGDDPFSDRILNFITDQDLGTDNIGALPGKSPGLYAITTTADGERSFTYWRETSAARQLFQNGGSPDFSVLAGYDMIYLSGITMAILPHSVRLALLEWLNVNDVLFAYDSNYRPRLWQDQETAKSITRALWHRADIGLPSIDDEMELFNETADQVTRRFASMPLAGALKRGDQGPLSLGDLVEQTYHPAQNVIDTTAAGDSFNGGYLSAILTGATQAQALLAGHNCAAHVVQYRGAIVPPQTP